MNHFKTESLGNGQRFIIIQKKSNPFILIVLTIITLVTIAIPIQVLVSSDVSQAAIIGAVISAVLAAYLHRLVLWNAFGKEVFEINNEKFRHYTDYKLFKDILLDLEKPGKLIFDCDNLENSEKGFVLYVHDLEKELTRSNIKLPKDTIEELISLMKKHF